MMMKPKDFLKSTESLAKAINLAKTKEIAVGLPKSSSLTRKIYKKKGKGNSKTVLDIGVIHEYGLGKNPVRSFLRVPFAKKKSAIEQSLKISFQKVAEKGADPINQLERNGAFIKDISLQAFNNEGYGTWQDIKSSTKKRKGSSKILTDTGTLKQSITYVVRNAAS
jgi:hypothetical protein